MARRRPSIAIILMLVAMPLGLAVLRHRGRSTCDTLWLTSQHWNGDAFTRRQWAVVVGGGSLVLRTETLKTSLTDPWLRSQWQNLFPDERRIRFTAIRLEKSGDLLAEKPVGRWGVGHARRDLSDKPESIDYRVEHSLIVPFWLVFGVMFLSVGRPAVALFRRKRRRRRGWCVYCGYDLRGSQARCPECGTKKGAGASFNPPVRSSS